MLNPTADIPFALPPDLITTVVDLPMPPSTNRLWSHGENGRGGKVFLGPAYRKWKAQADLLAIANRVYRGIEVITGPFEAHIALNKTVGKGDLDNRVKALLDWAQSREMIRNDKFCMRLIVEWVEPANAPDGCRLTLREMAA